ncbi:MAG: hypothetical protein AAGI88_09085 [Pseudomonadota bacterium]
MVVSTPIPQLLLAFEGKIDCVTKTNPFGAKPKRKPADEDKLKEQRALFNRMKLDAWSKANMNKRVKHE